VAGPPQRSAIAAASSRRALAATSSGTSRNGPRGNEEACCKRRTRGYDREQDLDVHAAIVARALECAVELPATLASG